MKRRGKIAIASADATGIHDDAHELVPRMNNVTSFYPSISNDSKLVVFNQSTCGTDPDVNRRRPPTTATSPATATTTRSSTLWIVNPARRQPGPARQRQRAGGQRQLVAALQPRQGQLPRRADLLGRVLVAAPVRVAGQLQRHAVGDQAAALDRGGAHRREHRRRSELGAGLAAHAESEADRAAGQPRSAVGQVRRRHRGLTLSSAARVAWLAAGLLRGRLQRRQGRACRRRTRRHRRRPRRDAGRRRRRQCRNDGRRPGRRASRHDGHRRARRGDRRQRRDDGRRGHDGQRGRCGQRRAAPATSGTAGTTGSAGGWRGGGRTRHRRRERRLPGRPGQAPAAPAPAARARGRRHRRHRLRHAGRDDRLRGLHGRRRQLHERRLHVRLRHAPATRARATSSVRRGWPARSTARRPVARSRSTAATRPAAPCAAPTTPARALFSAAGAPARSPAPARLVQGRRHGRGHHEHDRLFGQRLVPGPDRLLGRLVPGDLLGPAVVRDGRAGGRRARTRSPAAATARATGKVRCSGNSCTTDCTGPTGLRDGRLLLGRELHADADDAAVPVAAADDHTRPRSRSFARPSRLSPLRRRCRRRAGTNSMHCRPSRQTFGTQ